VVYSSSLTKVLYTFIISLACYMSRLRLPPCLITLKYVWEALTWSSRCRNSERMVLTEAHPLLRISYGPQATGCGHVYKEPTPVTHHIISWWWRQSQSPKHWIWTQQVAVDRSRWFYCINRRENFKSYIKLWSSSLCIFIHPPEELTPLTVNN
jgi:hypothetical protein